MLVKKRFYQSTNFWRSALIIGLVLLYCGLYWDDVVGVFLRKGGSSVLQLFTSVDSTWVPSDADLRQAIANLIKFVLVFIVSLVVSILFASQFILPVQTLGERWKVFWRLARYAFHRHGPAIFIEKGVQIARHEELNRPYPGLIFVDMNSAIVLEKKSKPLASVNPLKILVDRLRRRPETFDVPKLARAEGPGIVFLGADERIRGVADLRRQFRTNPGDDGKGVKAYTSDGIEVFSNIVLTIFSLGQLPDVLDVAYVGGDRPENLRVLSVDKKTIRDGSGSEARWRKVDYIKGISQDNDAVDMDIEDKREIHGFTQDRLQIENLLTDLEKQGLDEAALLRFVRSLRLRKPGAVQKFISNLYANRQAAYRGFVNRLKPVDTETLHRFVINQDVLNQLVDEVMNDKAEARQVKKFLADLLTSQAAQAIDFYQSLGGGCRQVIDRFLHRFYTAQQIPPSYRPPRRIGSSPFYFDERRVFAALYANARNPGKDEVTDWTKLTPQVATEHYRAFISRYPFDKLLGLELEKPSQVGDAKAKLGRTMRYQGVLAYRLIRRRDGQPPQKDDILDPETYILDHPVLELRNPKVLRDRGIKVLVAGFSELRISDPAIGQQRVDNWRARWESEALETMSDYDIAIMKGRSAARADAQRKLIQNLSEIYSQPFTKEAMAVRIFQSLERAAIDPETRRLLPQDTLAFIQNLRTWLIKDAPSAGDKPADGPLPGGPTPPFVP